MLSEEGRDDLRRLEVARVWIVDPLDGTREFGEPPRTDWAVHVALTDHGVPVEHSDEDALQLLGWTEATATPQVEVALRHPKVTMIANALGTPPPEVIAYSSSSSSTTG